MAKRGASTTEVIGTTQQNAYVHGENSKKQQRTVANGSKVSVLEMSAAASTILQHIEIFCAEKSQELAPPKHTFLYKLWRTGRLDKRQCLAADQIYEDVVSSFGKSNGLVSSWSEQIDGTKENRQILAYYNPAAARFIGLLERLHNHERKIVVAIIKDYHQNVGGKLDLKAFGALISGYEDKAQAYAAGASRIQAVLTSAAEYYNFSKK